MNEPKENGGCSPRLLRNALDDYLKHHNINTLTKRKRIIAAFICASLKGWKLTRFDAEHIGDHCLNTTVSEIGRDDGVVVSRRETKRPTRFGKDADWQAPSILDT
jgi:hypothetical protein